MYGYKIKTYIDDVKKFRIATEEEINEVIDEVFEELGIYEGIKRNIYHAISTQSMKVLYFKDEDDINKGIRSRLENNMLLVNPEKYNEYITKFCGKLGINYGTESGLGNISRKSRFYFIIEDDRDVKEERELNGSKMSCDNVRIMIDRVMVNSLSELFNEVLSQVFEKALIELGFIGFGINDICRFMSENNISIDKTIDYNRNYCYVMYRGNNPVSQFTINAIDYKVEYRKLDV